MTTTKKSLEITGTSHMDVVGEMLVVDGLWADDWNLHAGKADAKGMEACVCCGRAVKPGSGSRIWLIAGNEIAPVASYDEMIKYEGDWVGSDLGTWAIGPDCAKNIPSEYRTKNLA